MDARGLLIRDSDAEITGSSELEVPLIMVMSLELVEADFPATEDSLTDWAIRRPSIPDCERPGQSLMRWWWWTTGGGGHW